MRALGADVRVVAARSRDRDLLVARLNPCDASSPRSPTRSGPTSTPASPTRRARGRTIPGDRRGAGRRIDVLFVAAGATSLRGCEQLLRGTADAPIVADRLGRSTLFSGTRQAAPARRRRPGSTGFPRPPPPRLVRMSDLARCESLPPLASARRSSPARRRAASRRALKRSRRSSMPVAVRRSATAVPGTLDVDDGWVDAAGCADRLGRASWRRQLPSPSPPRSTPLRVAMAGLGREGLHARRAARLRACSGRTRSASTSEPMPRARARC